MAYLNPLATGLVEGTLLALLGLILFQLRHRAGLIPFIFLLGGLALTIPFTAHLTPLRLAEPWTISRAYAIVLPVFVTLVLLLHTFIGSLEARAASSLPLLGGALVAAAGAVSNLFPIVIPQALLPRATEAVLAGAILGLATVAATVLFEWWHRYVTRASPVLVFVASSLAGVLVHGVLHQGVRVAGIPLPGGGWPAIVAVPLVAGAATVAFVAVYAEALLGDLEPIAERHDDRGPRDEGTRDLDRYRRAEDQYREAVTWVQEANEALERYPVHRPVGVFVADPDGRILHANDALGWMLGRTPEDVIGTPAHEILDGTREPDGATGRSRPSTLGEGTYEATVQLPDGTQRALEVELARTRDDAVRGEVRDTTTDQLRERAEVYRDRARFALDLLGRDLPNYLAAPRTAAERLSDEARRNGHGEPLAELADRVHHGLEDLQDALERVRPLRALDEAEREPIDLHALVKQAVEELPHDELDDVQIRWDVPSGPIAVDACPLLDVAFREILDNVLVHAGPTVRLVVRITRDGSRWRVTFDDDGPGVPNELKDRVFEGFTQGTDGRGAGVGLPLAQAIVEGCGGRVWVEDRVPGEPEHGASFRLWVPGARSEGSSNGHLDPHAWSAGNPRGDEEPAGAAAG